MDRRFRAVRSFKMYEMEWSAERSVEEATGGREIREIEDPAAVEGKNDKRKLFAAEIRLAGSFTSKRINIDRSAPPSRFVSPAKMSTHRRPWWAIVSPNVKR